MTQLNDQNWLQDAANIGPEQFFQEALKNGQLMIQRCEKTGRAVMYPRTVSPFGGGPLRWEHASGKGTVYASTVTRRRPERGGDYNIALIDLDEGARLMSTVVDIEPDQVVIGMPVCAEIRTQADGEPLLVFKPAQT